MKILTATSLFSAALFFFCSARLGSAPSEPSYEDGPYYIYLNDGSIKALSIANDPSGQSVVQERVYALNDVAAMRRETQKIFEAFDPLETFRPSPKNEYTAGRIAAISDIHGSYNHLKALLAANKIIDELSNWSWGDGHLVIVGDITDKGPHVTECLWLIRKLETQAEKQGGKVHLLLGNHEKMILAGTNTHTPVKYRKVCEKLTTDYARLFAPDTYFGRWLRTRSIAVRINNILFVHGGISEKLVDNNYTLEEMNTCFNVWASAEPPTEQNASILERAKFLRSYYGPLEYRGYFNNNLLSRGQSSELSDATIDKILGHFKVDHIAVGHTVVRKIKPLFDNKVIALDLRLPTDDIVESDGTGQLLIVEGNAYCKAGMQGKKQLLFSDKNVNNRTALAEQTRR